VNVEHLREGTVAENNADAINKGRAANGERHGAVKLTDLQVTEIRRLRKLAGFRGTKAIAENFGIAPGYVRELCRGAWRKHPTMPGPGAVKTGSPTK